MRYLRFREASLTSVMLLMAAGMALTACSSGSSSSPSASPSTASAQPTASSAPAAGPSAEPSTGAGAIAAIKANWVAFFNAKTPIARRVALLQNGQVFSPVIKAQAGSPLAQLASARVTKVTLTGTDQAAVTYDILAGGQAGLTGQSGVAVYQDGIWKVGDASFCGLLRLENGGSSGGLPTGCRT